MWPSTFSRRLARRGVVRLSAPYYSSTNTPSAVSAAASANTSSSSSSSPVGRVLCIDVPTSLADASCVPELVQRGHVVDQVHAQTREQLETIIDDYDALLVSPKTKVPREILAQGARAKLKLIAVPSDAIDSGNVDIMEATHQGIVLMQLDKKQVGDKFSVEAEIGLSLLIQLARNIPSSIATTRSSEPFQREQFTGTELYNKNLGIVGLGQAGKCVVEMARAMGLHVFGYDPNLTHEAAQLMGVTRVTLDQLYAQSDILAFHAPLTARTRGMFDDAALAKCKPGVRIVSVAEFQGRTGLLNDETLLKGLASGQIAGVALDVLQSASDAEDDGASAETWAALAAHERVLIKTHADGKASDLAEGKRYRAIAENVGDALAQRYYRGVANGVYMPLTLVPEMQPFLQLSEALGKFLFQLTVTSDPKDKIAKVSIATSGGIQVDITSPQAKSALQSAVMKGILGDINAIRGGNGFGTPRICLLNASMLAMTNGIDVRMGELRDGSETTSHLNNSITVEVETKNNVKYLVMGSVFGEDPRIVRINEYTDFPAFRPEGNLLIFRNEDRPGAIAGILKELAAAKINIANFGLSRQVNVPLALGILSLDAVPTSETMDKLKALSTVDKIQFARV